MLRTHMREPHGVMRARFILAISEGSQFLKVDENGGEPEFVSKVILNAFSPSVVSNGKGVVLSSPGINVDRAPSFGLFCSFNWR